MANETEPEDEDLGAEEEGEEDGEEDVDEDVEEEGEEIDEQEEQEPSRRAVEENFSHFSQEEFDFDLDALYPGGRSYGLTFTEPSRMVKEAGRQNST